MVGIKLFDFLFLPEAFRLESGGKMNRLVFSLLLVGLTRCGYQEYKPGFEPQKGAGGGNFPVVTEPSFSAIQSTIVQTSKCSRCHGEDSSFPLTSYDALMEYVVPGDAASSLLYEALETGRMPRRQPKLGQADIDLVRAWIEAGALNN